LALCWLGYFSPWLWPTPAALRLSAHDLVEWMTFMQTVRDGTFPVTRLDLLWPLAGIAVLTALASALSIARPKFPYFPYLPYFLLSLFAAGLILPPYEFLRIAYNDPELAPQFWLGIATGIAAPPLALFAGLRPVWARRGMSLIASLSLIASIRAYSIIQPPFTDILTKAAPTGYGFVLIVLGFSALVILPAIELARAVISRPAHPIEQSLTN
jgi:hypothetical protein